LAFHFHYVGVEERRDHRIENFLNDSYLRQFAASCSG